MGCWHTDHPLTTGHNVPCPAECCPWPSSTANVRAAEARADLLASCYKGQAKVGCFLRKREILYVQAGHTDLHRPQIHTVWYVKHVDALAAADPLPHHSPPPNPSRSRLTGGGDGREGVGGGSLGWCKQTREFSAWKRKFQSRSLHQLSGADVVEYFGTRINGNRFPKVLGYFGTIPIYPAPGGKIFANFHDISEPPSRRLHMIFWVSRRFQIRVYALYTFYLLFIQSRLAFMSLKK